MALRVLAVALASYRVTRLVVTDDIVQPARKLWFRRFPLDTKPGTLFSCTYCAGFWVSGLMLLVAHLTGFARWPVRYDLVLWWTVSGAQALLNALDARLDG